MPAKYAFEPVIAGTWGNECKNDENDVICYRAADFDYEHLKVNESAGVVRNIAPSEFVVKALHPGDILIEKSGGGEKTLVGRSVLFDSNKASVCSNFVSVLRPKSGQSSRYWNYQLAALYSNRGTEPFIKQSTGIQNLDVKAYLSQHVPVRSFEEQERIADELDRELTEIDELIAECVQLSVLAEERRLSAINNFIEPLLDKKTAIKHLGTLTSGITLGAAYNEPTQSYPYLRVANVQVGRVDLTEVKEVSVPVSVANENSLQKDDVLMTEGGDRDKLGRGAIWSGEVSPMLHQNHVFAFRCNKEKLLPEFLVYCLEASYARRYFENNARQSTNLASTNSTIVKNFLVPSIEVSKQNKVISALDNQLQYFNTIINLMNIIHNLLSERKISLLSRVYNLSLD
ncbi:hypothetical protein [Rothia nasimurium]|uniref:restriction endonuclease subunit S n=1 Tax=Rothia nasimurium TaxID=85336 RepID=UPI001623408E|nr:hypothetical protein [Rothia nasimurium]